MLFREVANYFDEIEKSSSRLVMTKHLAELFKKTPFEDANKVVYLSLIHI